MKKTILTSIAAIAFTMPAIAANIPNDATCNSGVLGVSSGSANLEADYTANTINITWDGNGGSTPTGGASSCTYDSTFNLPAAPTKTGYTFAGWAVQAQSCFANFPAAAANSDDLSYGSVYEYTEEQNATWRADMVDESGNNYGIATGISKCSSTSGSWATVGTPSDTDGQYCWCQATSYTATGSSQCNVASPSWVFDDDNGSASICASNCASYCASNVRNYSDFRRALFGLLGA